MDKDYEPNLDDERVVDLVDPTEPDAPAATIDPDERVERTDGEIPPLDSEREEPV